MSILEFFGTDHRHEEIDEQQQCDDGDDDCFHGVFLQPLAETDVESADDKEGNDDADEN
jgi:hypothetical protein